MARRDRSNPQVRNIIKKYNKLNKISAIIWFLAGLGVLGFGIYFREIFEVVFGVFAILYSFGVFRGRSYSMGGIRKAEVKKLYFIMIFIGIYSLVNPIGNIALLFDLYKRDLVLNGGL